MGMCKILNGMEKGLSVYGGDRVVKEWFGWNICQGLR